MQTTNEENPLDREKLKEERRIRNKLKRERRKRENSEKAKNNVNKNIGSVAIVSSVFAEEYNRKKGAEPKGKSREYSVSVTDLVSRSVVQEKRSGCRIKGDGDKYSGNRLDSDRPVRSKGKHKELCKEKRLSKLKKEVNADHQKYGNSELVQYCSNQITENLEKIAGEFVQEVVILQEKLYQRDQIKGDLKRRYIVGFHECTKYLKAGKVKLLIITTDIKVMHKEDPLQLTINELVRLAEASNCLYVYVLKRRKLGALTMKFIPISCIGILNFDGANELYKSLVAEIDMAKKDYSHKSNTPDVVQDLIESMKEVLKS